MNKAYDDDINVFERELRSRNDQLDDLWEEQRAYRWDLENIESEKYCDSLEEEVRKIDRERNEVRDFMKYIVNIDHHYGMMLE